MSTSANIEIFLIATPGLEGPLCAEARAKGFKAKTIPGGVTLTGGWPEIWRANLEIRGAKFAGEASGGKARAVKPPSANTAAFTRGSMATRTGAPEAP